MRYVEEIEIRNEQLFISVTLRVFGTFKNNAHVIVSKSYKWHKKYNKINKKTKKVLLYIYMIIVLLLIVRVQV